MYDVQKFIIIGRGRLTICIKSTPVAAADDIIINLHIYSLCLVTDNWRSNIDLVLEIYWPCPNITATNAKNYASTYHFFRRNVCYLC